MKRGIILLIFALVSGGLKGQDNPTATNGDATAPAQTGGATAAAAMAERQAAQERYERMSADIQALQSANVDLANKVSALEDEVRKLRDQLAAQAGDTSLQETVKHLSEKIDDVDKRQQADKAAIADQVRSSIAELEKTLGQSGPAPVAAPPAPREREHPPRIKPEQPVDAGPPPDVANGFVYTIKDGDNLSLILKAYNADFRSKGMKTVTMRQAREANPKVDWNRLFVGQKIIIPRPAE